VTQIPNILAIETSSDACSVALSKGENSYSIHKVIPQKHTEKLFIILEEVLEKLSISYKDIDAIALGCGPGSFTGTRLACSVAQGLSYSLNIPAISISSLEILALGVKNELEIDEVNVLVNAHMNQIYFGNFCFELDNLKSCSEKVITVDEFKSLQFAQNDIFVGDGCDLVAKELKGINALILNKYPDAKDLLLEARNYYKEGKFTSPEDLAPKYLSGKEHWSKT
tara:strand:+ start:2224 stop:2898 length:675 start_codon:yes stop_codon:yes gene_type:complete